MTEGQEKRRKRPLGFKRERWAPKGPESKEVPTHTIEIEGRFKEVIDAIREKAKRIKSGEPHGHIRPLIFVSGGGWRAITAALLKALEDEGLTDGFAFCVGASSGSGHLAQFLAGTAEKNYRMHRLAAGIRGLLKSHIGPVPLLHSQAVGDIASGKRKRRKGSQDSTLILNQEAIQNAHPDFYTLVTNLETGELVLVNLKEQEDDTGKRNMIPALTASTMYPTMNQAGGKKLVIDGKQITATDGMIGHPLPVPQLIEMLGATHALVLINGTTEEKRLPPAQQFVLRRIAPHVADQAIRGPDVLKEALAYMRHADANYVPLAMVSGTVPLDFLDIDRKTMHKVYNKTLQEFAQALEKTKKENPATPQEPSTS